MLSKENYLKINPYKLGAVLDTTGAGDLYAGGFLHGYTSGKELRRCGQIGSICAGQIVTELGPRSKSPLTDLLNEILV